MPRHSLLAALVLLSVLAACARATQEEGWLVYGDPIPFVLFPQLPEPPFRFMNGSEISADPDAPLCASAPFVDIVRLVRVRLARADLPSLQLGLPFGYAWLAQGEHEGFRQTGEAWGGLLGFVRKDSVGVRLYGLQPGGVDDIAFWLGPRPGYPTSGLPPRHDPDPGVGVPAAAPQHHVQVGSIRDAKPGGRRE